jgi:thioredoxin reductase
MSAEHEVVVIGGGPTAAGAVRALARRGQRDVVVLEREPEAGGIPRHCGHTGYGLAEYGRLMTGPSFGRCLAAELGAGSDLRRRHTVRGLQPGGRLSVVGPEGSYELIARAVLLATGARETPRSARLVGGIRAPGIMTTGTLQQFVYLQGTRPARRVVIIGTELVSFSAILTCRHAGIEIAAMIGEGARTLARWPADLVSRHAFGVPVLRGAHLEAIEGGQSVTGLRLRHASGETSLILCDGVIFTGKFRPETALLADHPGLIDPGSRGPSIDQFRRLALPGYFAAGNLVHPVETAGRCFRDGMAAGEAIADHLAGNLPALGGARSIRAAGAIRSLYPQRLAGEGVAPIHFQVSEEVRGRLEIRLDGALIWSRPRHYLPERRLTIPPWRLAGRSFAEAEVRIA